MKVHIAVRKVNPYWGLMFRPPSVFPVLIEVNPPRLSPRIHTFFVFYSIDVAFLSPNHVVRHITRLSPFTWYSPPPRKPIGAVLEAQHLPLRVGDQVELEVVE